MLEGRKDDVRSHRFDLVANERPAGKPHGDDQHDAAAADHDTEHSERGAHTIGAQRLDRQVPRLGPSDRRSRH